MFEEMENNIVTDREEENENWESQHNVMLRLALPIQLSAE